MFLFRWDGVYPVKEAIWILLDLVVTVGRVENGTEGWPVACNGVGVQPLFLVDGLWSGIKVLHELVAQVNVYLPEGAFPFAESFGTIDYTTKLALTCSDYIHNGREAQLRGNPMAATSTDVYVVINVFRFTLNASLRPIESSQ